MPVQIRRLAELPGVYSGPLAEIHNLAFSDHVKGAGPEICRLLTVYGIHRGRVLDLACGGGQLAVLLASRGYETWGFDASRTMLAIARKRDPSLTFVAGDLARHRLPRCVAAFAVGEGLSYLRNAREARSVFRRVAQALEPGGLFVFDARVKLPGAESRERTIARVETDWALFARIVEDHRAGRLTRRITSFRRRGRWFARADDTHRQRLYPTREILAWLRAAGFRALARRGYGPFPLGSDQRVFIARR